MIIFSGLGFLVVGFFVIFGAFIYQFSPNKWGASNGPFAFTLLLAGLASGLLGWFLQKRKARILAEKPTGKPSLFMGSDSLFFIPMLYWGPFLIFWGLYLLIRG